MSISLTNSLKRDVCQQLVLVSDFFEGDFFDVSVVNCWLLLESLWNRFDDSI